MSKHYYYTRTSTIDQQGERFDTNGFEKSNIFFDKSVSGSISFFDRPKAKELVKLIEKNQVSSIYVPELDRLGRNTEDLLKVLKFCNDKKVNLKIQGLPESLNSDGSENLYFEMIFTCISAVAKMELRLRKERTAQGIAKYKEKHGKFGGRKKGAVETRQQFLDKPKNKEISLLLKQLELQENLRKVSKVKIKKDDKLTIRKIASIVGSSPANVQKVKNYI